MPYFNIFPTLASSAVGTANAELAGNLDEAYLATIYGNRNWGAPLWEAFLVPDRTSSVFGAMAASEWGLSDGDELVVMFYDHVDKKVNGYKTTIRVTSKFSNPYAIFLSWKVTSIYFSIFTDPPGSEHLKAKQPPLKDCIFVNYP